MAVTKSGKAAIRKLTIEIDRIETQLKELYEQKDAAILKMKKYLAPGESYVFDSGVEVMMIDNYANTNVVFRPAAVRRFEVMFRVLGRKTKNKTISKASEVRS